MFIIIFIQIVQTLYARENISSIHLAIVITWRCLQPENRLDLVSI